MYSSRRGCNVLIECDHAEDVPSENALRDTLHSKIKESPALKMELLVSYDMLTYDDPKRSYKTLLHLIDRCIQKQREKKMLKQTQVGLQQMIQGKDPLSAIAAKVKGTETATPAPKKPTKPPKHEEAAPVLPKSKAKAHAKAKAGKGKGKGKDGQIRVGRCQGENETHTMQILLFRKRRMQEWR